MKKMKKIFFTIFTFFFTISLFSLQLSKTENSAFNEAKNDFESGFFPGAISKTQQFESDFPESVYKNQSVLIRAQSFLQTGKISECILETQNLLPFLHSGSEERELALFILGLAYKKNGESQKALNSFYEVCNLCKKNQRMKFYYDSILNSAQILYEENHFSDAILLFEFIVQNGNSYDKKNYDNSLLNLFDCYNKTKNFSKTIDLFLKLNSSDFSKEIYAAFCIFYADSLVLSKNDFEAFTKYCEIVRFGLKNTSLTALKKAYVVASKNNFSTAEIFSEAEEIFKENPEFTSEFWARLASDEYNLKNYEKSLEYFKNSAEYLQNESTKIFCDFYVQKIKFNLAEDFQKKDKNFLNEILNELLALENKISLCEFKDFSDSFYSFLLELNFRLENFEKVTQIFEKIQNPKNDFIYMNAVSLFNEKKFLQVEEFLQNQKNRDEKCELLYANVLSQNKKFLLSENSYKKVISSNPKVKNQTKIECSKVLFSLKKFNESQKILEGIQDFEAFYIRALCFLNLNELQNAYENFCLSYDFSTDEFIKGNSLFYKGYCAYSLGKFGEAYTCFDNYSRNFKKYKIQSVEYACRSAILDGSYTNAAFHAENLIELSENQKDKENAIIMCAEIYSEGKKYDKALEILSLYAEENSDFGIQTLFLTADVYKKSQNVQKADEFYTKVYSLKNSKYSEEALFRSAELHYSQKNYETASQKFNRYIYDYPEGRFFDVALYFCADCFFKIKNYDRAILLNLTLIQNYPKSIYLYGAYKNLSDSYIEQKNYSAALNICKTVKKEFPDQAKSDGTERRILLLERILSGETVEIAKKYDEFLNAGKDSTKKGRKIGTELVELYSDSGNFLSAYELAKILYEKQLDSDENEDSAKNAQFIAEQLYRNGEFEDSAKYYLDAATKFRESQSQMAAVCLYGAADSFRAAKLNEDSRQIADLLIKLYPTSEQALRASEIFK